MRMWKPLGLLVVVACLLAACASSSKSSASSSGGSQDQSQNQGQATQPPSGESSPAASGQGSSGTAPTVSLQGKGVKVAAVGDLVCAFGTKPPPKAIEHEKKAACNPIPAARAAHAKNYKAFLPLGDLQ